MQVNSDVSLQPYNTFGIDVEAKHLIEVHSIKDLQKAVLLPHQPKLVLGGGSNMLFSKPFEGLVILNSIKGRVILSEYNTRKCVAVGAGEPWHPFVQWCLQNNLGGVENLSLIPGTVGAAPIQNIGAYGVEFEEVFDHLEAVSLETGEIRTFSKQECAFGYRSSIFKKELKGQYAIARVYVSLTHEAHPIRSEYGAINTELARMKVDVPTIIDVSRAVVAIRQAKLPDPGVLGNAGSFFKNPVIPIGQYEGLRTQYPDMPSYRVEKGLEKVPAAWLIEQCGWKGYRKGDAGVYDHHALVLVNHGTATGHEIHSLALAIQSSVQEVFNIQLEPEVNVL